MTWDVTTDPDEFQEAVAWFVSKRPVTREQWDKLTAKERRKAFVVSGVAKIDAVKQVQDAVAKAIKNGQSLDEFKKSVIPSLRSAWGGDVNHPGAVPNPGWRIETIFRTNLQHAYAAGRWREMTRPEVLAVRPYWMFDSVLDARTTPQCQSLDGTVLEAHDPFWETHTPPLHFCCRSSIRSLRESQAKKKPRFGQAVPEGSDAQEGFGLSPFELPPKSNPAAETPPESLPNESPDAPAVGAPPKGVKPFKASAWRETERNPVPDKAGTYDTPLGLLDGVWGRDDVDPDSPEHKARLDSIRKAYDEGKEKELPPIRVFYTKDGKLEIDDGNHRLMVAMERHVPSIPVVWQKSDHAGGGYLKRLEVPGPKAVVYEWRPDVSQYPPELRKKVKEVIERASSAESMPWPKGMKGPTDEHSPSSPVNGFASSAVEFHDGEAGLKADKGFKSAVNVGISAADKVHGEAKLPVIVHLEPTKEKFLGSTEHLDDGTAKVKINCESGLEGLVALHELGHVLNGIGNSIVREDGKWNDKSSAVKALKRAIIKSLAYEAIVSELERARSKNNHGIVAELMEMVVPAELWARAYAQYVVLRSNSKTLQAQLDATRIRHDIGKGVPFHWDDAEFELIATEIDNILGVRGWSS